MLTHAAWQKAFEDKEALWLHSGRRAQPHVILSSGLHSGGFFRGERVTEDPCLVRDICRWLIDRLEDPARIKRVVGVARGGITLASALALGISDQRTEICLSGVAEKDGSGGWRLSFEPRRRERVLVCDDVFTTGGSLAGVIETLVGADATPCSQVVVLLNRSALGFFDGRAIEAPARKLIETWSPAECPLCAQGSLAVRPEGLETWQQLRMK